MTTTDDLDAPPSPNGSRPSLGGLGSLLFRQPEEETPPAETTQPEESAGPPASSPSVSEWPPGDESDPSDGDPTSSPESSAEGPVGRLALAGKRQLQKTFRAGVKTTGGVAHRFASRSEGQRMVGMYLADDEDAAGIGDPLASIAHRRGGVVGKMSEDTNDALQALMALGGYVAKQMVLMQQAAQVDQQLAAGVTPGEETGQ